MSIDKAYDRDGNVIPEDWYDASKYDHRRMKWATQQRIANTQVGEFTVSTVWLYGIDHNWGGGPPLLFETMVFGGEHDHELARYSTEEQAMRGHLAVLDRLRAGRPPFAHLDGDDAA